jgi:hypothetical protein
MTTYQPFVFFGYEIQLPSDASVSRSINMLYDLNGMIDSPFEIKCLLSTFYPAMNEEEYARMVIGFCPESIEDSIDLARDLSEFIEDTPLLDGLEVAPIPLFHCGIEWCPEIGSDDESDEYDEDDEGQESEEGREEGEEESDESDSFTDSDT